METVTLLEDVINLMEVSTIGGSLMIQQTMRCRSKVDLREIRVQATKPC